MHPAQLRQLQKCPVLLFSFFFPKLLPCCIVYFLSGCLRRQPVTSRLSGYDVALHMARLHWNRLSELVLKAERNGAQSRCQPFKPAQIRIRAITRVGNPAISIAGISPIEDIGGFSKIFTALNTAITARLKWCVLLSIDGTNTNDENCTRWAAGTARLSENDSSPLCFDLLRRPSNPNQFTGLLSFLLSSEHLTKPSALINVSIPYHPMDSR